MTKNKKLAAGALRLLIVVLLGIIVYSGYHFYIEYKEFYGARRFYSALSMPTAAASAPQSGAGTQAAAQPTLDFAALRAQNADAVAWLRCAGTPINYPVLQGSDNAYYLRHLPDGSYNVVGSIFMDWQNAPDFTDGNIVLYGHHIENETTMFATLTNYGQQSYYDAHPTLQLYTPQGNYTIELFAGHLASAQTTLPLHFASGAAQQAFVSAEMARSDFRADIEVAEGDRLVTMATCAYNFSNARYLLFGRLVPA